MSIGHLGAVDFLWGAIKDKCYANQQETIEALKHEIEAAIHGIEAKTIENVLKNWWQPFV